MNCVNNHRYKREKEIEIVMVGNHCSILVKCKICSYGGLIQEEHVGEDQNMKGLEGHEKDFRVYSVGNREIAYWKF